MATEIAYVVAPAVEIPSRAVGEIAARHFGAIARWQLLAAGHSPSRVGHWRACGRLHTTAYPGVYAWGRPELSERGELAAALLFCGSGAALGSISCLWWRGLLYDRPDAIHVDAPGHSRSIADLRIRHPRDVERSWHRGLPIVPLPAALLPAAEHLAHDELRRVLARAEFEGILSLGALQSEISSGARGARKLRAAMAAHLPALARCVNDLEIDFVLLCERFRLPIPLPNERVSRYRPDMLWHEQRLIVELDGDRAHSTPAQRLRDAARQRWLEQRGYRVIRFRWQEVMYRPEWVAAQVAEALGR